MKEQIKKIKRKIIFLELALAFFLLPVSFSLFFSNVFAGVGENVTVSTNLTIGQSNPNIISINVDGGSVTLTPNSTTIVNCSVIAEDYAGELDINLVNATLYATVVSTSGDFDDENYHYTNSSCVINTSYGDSYQIKADCFFSVNFNANPGNWNCSVFVGDVSGYNEEESNQTDIEELLAFGLPDRIDYGTINATYVSGEREANVTNVGNVRANLSLSGL